MQRKNSDAVIQLNGYTPEKGLRRHLFWEVNGFAPDFYRRTDVKMMHFHASLVP